MAIIHVKSIVVNEITIVHISLLPMNKLQKTGRAVSNDVPKSPCRIMFFSHNQYRVKNGLSNP